MSTHLSRARYVLLSVCLWLLPMGASATTPKLDIMAGGGGSGTSFVPRAEGRESQPFVSWQGGFGARLRVEKRFYQFGMTFSRLRFEVEQSLYDRVPDFVGRDDLLGQKGKMNSIDLPILAGWIPYRNHIFKLYVYGGLVNRFNTRGFIDLPEDGKIKFKPKDIEMAIYLAMARMAVAFDIAMVNFEFNYNIGLNSAFTTDVRVNTHVLQLNVHYLF